MSHKKTSILEESSKGEEDERESSRNEDRRRSNRLASHDSGRGKILKLVDYGLKEEEGE